MRKYSKGERVKVLSNLCLSTNEPGDIGVVVEVNDYYSGEVQVVRVEVEGRPTTCNFHSPMELKEVEYE